MCKRCDVYQVQMRGLIQDNRALSEALMLHTDDAPWLKHDYVPIHDAQVKVIMKDMNDEWCGLYLEENK
jgi:hypothetical protein